MPYITVKDGTEIFYKDWGQGPVVTFSHGWPLSSDAWDGQMLFLAQNGFRVVAHDRRGHGRSSQASSGNDMNGYADDLGAGIEALGLTDATLVGHSTGGGEVARPRVGAVFSMENFRQAHEQKPVRGKNVLRIVER